MLLKQCYRHHSLLRKPNGLNFNKFYKTNGALGYLVLKLQSEVNNVVSSHIYIKLKLKYLTLIITYNINTKFIGDACIKQYSCACKGSMSLILYRPT